LADHGIEARVGSREPSTWVGGTLVVLHDDGGPQPSEITFDRSVGVSVLAGTREDRREAKGLARLVYALATNPGVVLAPGSPVALIDIDGCTGPYQVPEDHDCTRYHMSIAYILVGEIIPDDA